MHKHLKTSTILSRILDTNFGIGKFRFGVDPLLNFIPGLGQIISALLALYILWVAKELGIPQKKLRHMFGYVIFDFVLGFIPIVRTVGDFFYKANNMNIEIVKNHVKETPLIDGEIVASSKQ